MAPTIGPGTQGSARRNAPPLRSRPGRTPRSPAARASTRRSRPPLSMFSRREPKPRSPSRTPAAPPMKTRSRRTPPPPPPRHRPDRVVTYEELRERLHRRLEELRSTRNTRPADHPRKHRDDRMKGKGREKADLGFGKRKRDDKSEEDVSDTKKKKPEEKEKDPSSVDLSFGHVKLGDKDYAGAKKRKKKLSKQQELEMAKQLEEAKKDPEKGEVVSKKHSWKAAVNRAAGVKVHDDPKLLKESIKKEKKKHQKNAQKWKERSETREKLMAEKQKKRSDNIKERIHQTKLRKIEKREKKLMRPGFEGRKEGFLNDA
ncbi:unnamed protein product [Spirodela intermedia]|uniref:Ribosomal RNA-processing protein 14/surfeit locus protein 6 C-terminal domain-containing protein n=1 Tax=Spirodela intermedia TaxID=51605 RepID=A0A7I8IH17_SPIIN|nr:unnamed protein product [Spirodela intermedia]CAA6656353.1 unnamed protein product [Spirodela intermedia]